MGGGAKYASKVKLWASWVCMDGGDEQAFLRSLDISANLNQVVKEVEEDIVVFQNQFLTCIVILTRLRWRRRGGQVQHRVRAPPPRVAGCGAEGGECAEHVRYGPGGLRLRLLVSPGWGLTLRYGAAT